MPTYELDASEAAIIERLRWGKKLGNPTLAIRFYKERDFQPEVKKEQARQQWEIMEGTPHG